MLERPVENRTARYLRTMVNWALSPENAAAPTEYANRRKLLFLLGAPFDDDLTEGPIEEKLTDAETTEFQESIKEIWAKTLEYVDQAWTLRRKLLSLSAMDLQLQETYPLDWDGIMTLLNARLRTSRSKNTRPRLKGFTQRTITTGRESKPNTIRVLGTRVRDLSRRKQLQPSNTLRKEPREAKAQTTRGSSPSPTLNRILVLGMARGSSNPPRATDAYAGTLQLCQDIEKRHPGCIVQTLDQTHSATHSQVDATFHCKANFNKMHATRGGLLQALQGLPNQERPISSIVVSPLGMGPGCEQTYSDQFYAQTLPTLVTEKILGPGSEVWMPASDLVHAKLKKHLSALHEFYHIREATTTTDNLLLRALSHVEEGTAAHRRWSNTVSQSLCLTVLAENAVRQKRISKRKRREKGGPPDDLPPKDKPRMGKPLLNYFKTLAKTPEREATSEIPTPRVLRSQANPTLGPPLGTQELYQDIISDTTPALPKDFVLRDILPGRVICQSPDFELIIAKSSIENSGHGLFLRTFDKGIRLGGLCIDKYWGATGADLRTTRDNGAYVVEWQGHSVEADQACFSGYMNDKFELGTAFIQPALIPGSGGKPASVELSTILRGPVGRNSLIEIFINYSRHYWTEEKLARLPSETIKLARKYYGIETPIPPSQITTQRRKRKRNSANAPQERDITDEAWLNYLDQHDHRGAKIGSSTTIKPTGEHGDTETIVPPSPLITRKGKRKRNPANAPPKRDIPDEEWLEYLDQYNHCCEKIISEPRGKLQSEGYITKKTKRETTYPPKDTSAMDIMCVHEDEKNNPEGNEPMDASEEWSTSDPQGRPTIRQPQHEDNASYHGLPPKGIG